MCFRGRGKPLWSSRQRPSPTETKRLTLLSAVVGPATHLQNGGAEEPGSERKQASKILRVRHVFYKNLVCCMGFDSCYA